MPVCKGIISRIDGYETTRWCDRQRPTPGSWLVVYGVGLAYGRRWFYFSKDQIEKAQRWYQRYGFWSLVLAWLPGGDALTLIAGIMKVRLSLFFWCWSAWGKPWAILY